MIPLAWVERYQELGFIVHPCCPPDHRCKSPGKIPYDPYERQHMAGWQNHEQFSLEKWEEWLDLDPTINIGFLTGSPSKIVAVDIDSHGMAFQRIRQTTGGAQTRRYENHPT